ncbi:MAG TPA: gamma-glutamyltransferase family protein [Planctomycetota bacterium]|nr:gamma-glutamyltransferase family protein [Planctomycetota bacterium]
MAPSRRGFLGAAAALLSGCGGSFSRGGSPVGGMVATSQRHASEAGVEILRRGGNAVDAAVAAAAALAVTEPCSTGLGGDMFALVYDAATRTISALNGSGRCPGALSRDVAARPGNFSAGHANTVTVPGACAGWVDLLDRHGSRPLKDVLAPAIRLAEEGFAVGAHAAHFWNAEQLRRSPGARALLVDGHAPRAGERFRNPDYARTLKAVAAGGKEAYYRGDIARAIVKIVREHGGALAEDDLASHASTWEEPISTTYRGLRVWECPPNGQGLAALIALNILEGFDLAALDPLGPDRWHLAMEAMRLAFADTRWYVADPAVARVPVVELLSKDYAAKRRAQIDPRKAAVDVRRGSPVAGSDTVYFCTTDRHGNACSFINSNYMGFGTGLVPEGWGFPLQNRGWCFTLEEGHPNVLAPRKRPYHTIIPGMLTRADASLYGPFGVMGGFMQPQGHAQVVIGLADDRLSPQAALDRPRFSIDPDGGPSHASLEEGLPEATVEELRRRGHRVQSGVGGFRRALFGRGQVIRAADGGWEGGSDVRADGCALAE